MYTIIKSPKKSDIGRQVYSVDPKQVLTFEDGTVLVIEEIFKSGDGNTVIASTDQYQITLKLE